MQSKPREGALHHPAPWQPDEALQVIAAFDDLEAQRIARPQRAHPIEQRAAGAAIGPDEPPAHEAMPERLQHQLRPLAVLHPRRVDDDHQQQADGLDQDGPFASFDLLARVIAALRPSLVGRLDALRVNDGGGRL